ncbi:hypothetical protein Tco_0542287 [Tanacetum coccineum]
MNSTNYDASYHRHANSGDGSSFTYDFTPNFVNDSPNVASPTSYLDLSLPDYEAFFCDSEPDSGNFTIDVVEDISDNPTRELETDIRENDEKSSKNGQNRARNGKAWKRQSQIEAKKSTKSKSKSTRKSQQSKPEPTPNNT